MISRLSKLLANVLVNRNRLSFPCGMQRRRGNPRIGIGAAITERLEQRQLLTALANDQVAQTALRNQLLSGVSRIADMGQEGTIAVFGDNAISVLEGSDRETVVAAADDGVSRILATGKTGFADFANSTQFNTSAFYLNSLDWVSHGLGTTAKIVTDISSAKTWLQGHGFTNVTLRSDWENGLGQADVLVTYFSNPTAAQQTATSSFLAAGHGMFIGYNGWAFSYAGVTPLTSGGNALLRQHGLSWTDSVAWSFDGSIVVGTATGNAALAASVEATPTSFTAAQQVESSVAMSATFESVPATDPQLVAIRQAVLANASTVIPTPNTPVSDPNEMTRLKIESAVLPRLLPNELFVHRTASSYGAIPIGAVHVTKSLTFDISSANSQSQWLSTGLYAAPGDVLTVTVPAALVNQGWTLKIGSHDDDISDKTSYGRMPSGVSRDEPINATSMQVGSVYGGLIYLVKPNTTGTASHTVSISNAIAAPYFVLGQTTDAEWIATLRNLPAPYAELAAPNVIITLHSDDIRSLSNPTAVMTYWQNRIAAEDDLTNSPVPRTYAERIDDDLDISAGWMHSGYPVAAYDHNLANMVDSDPGDDWGFFHEFGHNHQSGYWTFSTEGEVTVNIMSMNAFDSTGTLPSDGWADMWTAAGRATNIPAFIAGGRLRSDAGNSLTTYAQLRAAFGWEPFRQFFRQYQTEATANLPQNDQQERDQWVTRFSNIVGKNLGPFFAAWGFAPSQAALDAVAGLPAWSWLEAVNPNPTISTLKNTAATFDPRTGFVDILSDPLTVTFQSAPAHGTLTKNANGTFTLTPVTGWSGQELLEYTIANSHGGTSSGTVTINVITQAVVGSPLDTDLRMESPNLNNSLATTLWVDGSTTNNQPAQMLLQFSSLFGSGANQIPSNAVITKATLQLQITDPGGSMKFHRLLQSWGPTDTWNSRVNGIQTDDIEALAAADLTTSFVNTGVQVFDLTASLQAWNAAPAGNFGWAVMPTSTNGVDISSAESATPPRLTVEYFVLPPANNPPVAQNDSAATTSGTAVTISVQSNDSDPDNNPLTTNIVAGPANGAVVVNANGTMTYTPTANFVGTTTLTYRVSDGALNSNTATVTISVSAPAPKFFTVDSTSDRAFRYQSSGVLISSSNLATTTTPSNGTSRGIAAAADGSRLWVIDANRSVYVYDAAGTLLGRWATSGLTSPTGISVANSDVWIVDSGTDRAYRFAGATTRLSGTVAATSNFALQSQNSNAQDIVTDGTTVWVVNSASTDRVYVYQASNGASLGNWVIDSANTSPTGITLDPTGASQSLWISDITTDRVYEYANARSLRSGSQVSKTSFALSSNNRNVQGIADPNGSWRPTERISDSNQIPIPVEPIPVEPIPVERIPRHRQGQTSSAFRRRADSIFADTDSLIDDLSGATTDSR